MIKTRLRSSNAAGKRLIPAVPADGKADKELTVEADQKPIKVSHRSSDAAGKRSASAVVPADVKNDKDLASEDHKPVKVSKKVEKKTSKRTTKPVKVEYSEGTLEDGITLEEASPYFPWKPVEWEQVLENIREMRHQKDAPVDTMGCDKCPDQSLPDKVSLFSVLKSAAEGVAANQGSFP